MKACHLFAVLVWVALVVSARADGIWSSESSYPVRGGNRVKIMVDGEAAFGAITKSLDAAQSYIYVTFAFLDLDFLPSPPDTRTIRDILVQAAARGVDVRVVIWSPTGDWGHTVRDPKSPIPGLNAGKGSVQARWDVAKGKGLYPAKIGCHHQKSFMMDSPTGDIAYVGGMNSVQHFWDTPAHDPADTRRGADGIPLHDLFASIQGPAVADVISNFRERYNQAQFAHRDATADVPKPKDSDLGNGGQEETQVQIVRTIAPKTYATLPAGERSIKEAYLKAIASAQQLIYLENQYVFDSDVVAALHAAAKRGVRVIGLLTRNPNATSKIGLGIRVVENLRQIGAGSLSDREAFYTPVVTVQHGDTYDYKDIYVHAKDMIVDDRFVTLGSANLSTMSTEFHSELNLLLNDPVGARALREELWAEHLQVDHVDPAALADPAAGFALWKQHAEANEKAWRAGAKPMSRVFPIRLFKSWDAAGSK